MWVKVADREEIGYYEINSNAQRVMTIIGESASASSVGPSDDCGIMLNVKTPMLLKGFRVDSEFGGNMDVECYHYTSPSLAKLIYRKPQIPISAGINSITAGIQLNPGKYFLRVSGKGIGILIKNTNKINKTHQFISVVGGAEVFNEVIPNYQELLNPDLWFAVCDLKIEVSKKSLYLGLLDDELMDNDLIPGAFYFWKNALWFYDGTSQNSIP